MLDLAEFLDDIRARLGGRVASAFEKIQAAINQTNTQNGTDPTQMTEPPHAPSTLNVAAGSDHVHLTITDPSQRARALSYFAEWSVNDPNFLAPHVEHLGASRGRVLALPAKNGAGTPYNYFFRAFSSTLGSKSASKKVYFGSSIAPTAVTLSGSSTLDLLPSTGSGTAATNGQQAGQGFGHSQFSKSGGPQAP